MDREDEDELFQGISRVAAGPVLPEEVGGSAGESVRGAGAGRYGEPSVPGNGRHQFREYHRGIQERLRLAPLAYVQAGIPDFKRFHVYHGLRLGLHVAQRADDAGASAGLPFPRTW